VPIWIASLGQKNVQATAEYADGWLPHLYAPELADKVWGEALRKGATKRSVELGPLQVAAGGMVAIGDDVKGMLDFMRPMYALYVGGMGARGKNFYNELACHYGFEAEAKQIQDLYLDGKKDEAAKAVPDELLEAMSLCGSEGYVKERLAAYKEAGVTVLNITPVSPDPVKLVEQVKGWIEDL
jgi:alkanesulfonate monooxygenase SsuD/methylene tetrahydromethanopterin reductase-like flavin-dependent oxidoreductase (luciferase family)